MKQNKMKPGKIKPNNKIDNTISFGNSNKTKTHNRVNRIFSTFELFQSLKLSQLNVILKIRFATKSTKKMRSKNQTAAETVAQPILEFQNKNHFCNHFIRFV